MRLMFGSTPRCGKSIGLYWNEVKMSEKYTYRGSTVYEHGEELSTIDIVDLLNNQQALINALKKENKKLKEELEKGFDVPIPYVENSLRRLRAEHKVDEQQATISDLKEENKRLAKNLKTAKKNVDANYKSAQYWRQKFEAIPENIRMVWTE